MNKSFETSDHRQKINKIIKNKIIKNLNNKKIFFNEKLNIHKKYLLQCAKKIKEKLIDITEKNHKTVSNELISTDFIKKYYYEEFE